MNVHGLSSNSCFDMKNDDDKIEVIHRNLNRAQVSALNPVKKCAAFNSTTLKVSWKILLIMHCRNKSIDQFSSLCAVRKHDTNISTILGGYSCSECKNLLYQIMPCNMCPICTQ